MPDPHPLCAGPLSRGCGRGPEQVQSQFTASCRPCGARRESLAGQQPKQWTLSRDSPACCRVCATGSAQHIACKKELTSDLAQSCQAQHWLPQHVPKTSSCTQAACVHANHHDLSIHLPAVCGWRKFCRGGGPRPEDMSVAAARALAVSASSVLANPIS